MNGYGLFGLCYSDTLVSEVEKIADPKVRYFYKRCIEKMGAYIDEHPDEAYLTMGEFFEMKYLP